MERFDRTRTDGDWYQRVHQEDTCQALGIDTQSRGGEGKYESHGGPSFQVIAKLLIQRSDNPEQEMTRLVEQMVFTVSIGNADAHGKNISLLHTQHGSVALAPLYDTVPTVMWSALRDRAAMSIGAVIDLPDITFEDLMNEVKRKVGPDGLEPSTSSLSGKRSNQAELWARNSVPRLPDSLSPSFMGRGQSLEGAIAASGYTLHHR